jgi:hypothetical protein
MMNSCAAEDTAAGRVCEDAEPAELHGSVYGQKEDDMAKQGTYAGAAVTVPQSVMMGSEHDGSEGAWENVRKRRGRKAVETKHVTVGEELVEADVM